MKTLIKKLRNAVNVVLLAPVKLPGKMLSIARYVALGLGIIDSVLDRADQKEDLDEDSQ